MVKHIVIWSLKENANNKSKQENALMIKQKLEALQGVIPGLIKIEVGKDFSCTANSGDIVLYSEFESKLSLAQYQNHPEHQAIVPLVGQCCLSRQVVDYDI